MRPQKSKPKRDTESTRGDETRQRLLDAAVEIFGERGFDGVRTRALADAAGVNQAAIPYYFQGKEGLYMAVARQLAERFGAHLVELARQSTDSLDAKGISRTQVLERLATLLAALARTIIGPTATAGRTGFLVREQLHPTAAFDLMYTEALEPLHRAISELVGRLTARPADDPDTILRAHALLGQVLGFAAAREALLRRLGWKELTPQHVEQIAAAVAELTAGNSFRT